MKTVKLKDLCLLIVDCPHSTPKWTDSGIVVLRNQYIKNGKLDLTSPSFTDEENYIFRTKRAVPKEGDIVITREAPMGEVCMIPAGLKCCLGQRMVLLRADPQKCDSNFLLFALQSKKVQEQISWNEGTGSVVSNLRIPVLESLEIPSLDLETQKYIGRTLKNIDDKIELNNQMNETLEAMAGAIFKEWFFDYGPVRAKAEGCRPFGMDDEIIALFPDSFEESQFGMIPKGWKLGIVSDFFEINPKYNLKKGEIYKYVEMKDLNNLSLSISSSRDREFSSGSRFSQGDTLVARISPCLENGKIGFVDFMKEGEVGWGSTEFVILRSKALIPFYASYLLAVQVSYRAYLAKAMQGTSGRQRTPDVAFSNYEIVLPDPTHIIWKSFDFIVSDLFQKIKNNFDETKILIETRELLLPRLISGEVEL